MPSSLSRRALLSSLAVAFGGGALVVAPEVAFGSDGPSVTPPIGLAPPGAPDVPTTSTAAPTTSTTPAVRTTPNAASSRYQVRDLDSGRDNTATLSAAFANAAPGDQLVIPPGDWPHDATIVLATSGVTVEGYGARLLARNPRRAGLHITGSDVTVRGLTHEVVGARQRGNGENLDDCPFSIDGAHDVVLQDIVSVGARDAGIFLYGAQRARLVNVQVRNSLADGVHITNGSTGCVVDSAAVLTPGDDGVAVVSYTNDAKVCADIRINNPLVVNGGARGIAISGGDRVVVTRVDVRRSRGSGVYVATETGDYNTAPVTACRIVGGTVDDANWDPGLDTGNVGVFQLVRNSTSRDIIIEGLTVTGSQKTAGPYIKVGTSNGAGGRFDGLYLLDIVLPEGQIYVDGGDTEVTHANHYSLASTSGGSEAGDQTHVTSGPAAVGDGITVARIRR